MVFVWVCDWYGRNQQGSTSGSPCVSLNKPQGPTTWLQSRDTLKWLEMLHSRCGTFSCSDTQRYTFRHSTDNLALVSLTFPLKSSCMSTGSQCVLTVHPCHRACWTRVVPASACRCAGCGVCAGVVCDIANRCSSPTQNRLLIANYFLVTLVQIPPHRTGTALYPPTTLHPLLLNTKVEIVIFVILCVRR